MILFYNLSHQTFLQSDVLFIPDGGNGRCLNG